MTPSKILFFCAMSVILGIALESFIKIPHAMLWGFLFLAAFCISISFFSRKPAAIAGLCLLFFVLGIARLQMAQQVVANNPLSTFHNTDEKVTFTGRLIADPDIRGARQQLKVKVDGTETKVLVTVFRYPEYHYPQTVEVTGRVQEPPVFDDFNYRAYLLKDGIYSLMSYPSIKVISSKPPSISTLLYSKLLQFKSALKNSINSQFLAPQSGILQGIILGGTVAMDDETKSKFQATGVTHLTAISGSNIVMLSYIMMVFLLAIGFWRGQALYFCLVGVWLYVAIAGFPASGIRAAIMASLFLLAQKFGRQHVSGRVIVLTAAVMLLQSPWLLLHDVGFRLSFLGSLGIIYIKPLLDILAGFLKLQKAKPVLDIIFITLAAQIFTLPIIAYNFKQVSLVAPVTNLLVIPVVDFIMVFGFLSAFLGIFSKAAGFFFFLPADFLLAYFVWVVEVFSKPWAALQIQRFYWIFIVAYYAVAAGVITKINRIFKLAQI